MRTKQLKIPADIESEIYSELRRILEMRRDLCTPINSFEPAEAFNGVPRFHVLFDRHSRVRFSEGLKLGGIGTLRLPDERVSEMHLAFMSAVWHLKDRLSLYAKATKQTMDSRSIADGSLNLRVCADIANWRKHGAHENRSGVNPRLSTTEYDTSKSGAVELFYDGVMKRKGLIVTHPVPITFKVKVLSEPTDVVIGVAREIANAALSVWLEAADNLGLLSKANKVGGALRSILIE